MAKSKKSASQKVKPETLTAKVALDFSVDYPTFHANHVDVAHGAYEFSIIFAEFSPRMRPEVREAAKTTGVLAVAPTAQVVLPPELIPGVIRALEAQLEKFQQNFGPLSDRKLKDSATQENKS
jgi:hypothetical protein